jgi:class 3 adenylate cyclase
MRYLQFLENRHRRENPTKELSAHELDQIKYKLLKGVVSRSSTLLFVWSFVGTVYGVLSLDLFHQFIPHLTIWENLWPRILLTGLPSLLLGFWYRNYEVRIRTKAYLTIVIMPALLLVASCIYAWPMFFDGNYDAYLYFHATNIIAMSSELAIISAPPWLVVGQALGFLLIYFGPLIVLFKDHRPLFPQLIVSDFLMIATILFFGLRAIYQLRVTLAVEDLLRRRKASSFLGKNLTKAIYESNDMKLKDRTGFGFIMSVDIRGYTKFMRDLSSDTTKLFMKDFHSMVASEIYRHGGYLHKTNGDGLIISFGIMDSDVDMSDIPGLETEEKQAAATKSRRHVKTATEAYQSIAAGVEGLRAKHGIMINLVIGAGLSAGQIDVIIRGDEGTRQELDIEGIAVIRAARLESYSKLLNKSIDSESSFLVLDPELSVWVADPSILRWPITNQEDQVRDFPDIKSVFYRRWKHNRQRGGSRMAA